MYRVIDGSDTGKTKKLLTICGEKGLFVCAHPRRTNEKCDAYGIPRVKSLGYDEFLAKMIENEMYNTNDNTPIYIDELEKFVNYCFPYLAGYTLTNE